VEIIQAKINTSNCSRGLTSISLKRTPEFILELALKKVTVFSGLLTLKTSSAFVSNLAWLGEAYFICLSFIF